MKNLKQKLLEVSKAIAYLKKDKQNEMQHYTYLSEAKIKETIKAEFEKQGILFNYSTHEVSHYEISPTKKGTKQFCTIATGSYRFLDVDSDEQINGGWAGSGTDTGDKGLFKAVTGGIKYVLSTNFLIPTGDDPEKDHENGNGKTESKPKKTETPKESEPKTEKGTGKPTTKMIDLLEKMAVSHLKSDKEKATIQKAYIDYNLASTLIGEWIGSKEKGYKDGLRKWREDYAQVYAKLKAKDMGKELAKVSSNMKLLWVQEILNQFERYSQEELEAKLEEMKES